MTAQPLSYRQYTGNGVTASFSVPFPYLLKAHVKVYLGFNILDGTYASELTVANNDYSWNGAGNQITTTVAPGAGQVLTVIRQTPSDARLVDWNDGSRLISSDLDTADLQNLYVVQEQEDRNDATTVKAVQASADAAAAVTAVGAALPYTPIGAIASIPVSPANNTRIEVSDSTGIEGFTPLSGAPLGFVGSSQIKVRLIYSTTGPTWQWVDYASSDPDARYVLKSAVSSSTTSTSATNVASSAAVKTAKDAADAADGKAVTADGKAVAAQSTANSALNTATAALPKSGGTMTSDLILDNQSDLRFREATANGTHYVALQAPASLAADVAFTLPNADGSSGQVLSTNGSGTLSWATRTEIPSGTVMLFAQTDAPTGWTKSTTHDNKALRVVSGTAGSGGSAAFTTAFASRTPSGSVSGTNFNGFVQSHTLTLSQIPSHTHTYVESFLDNDSEDGNGSVVNTGGFLNNTGAAGGGLSHDHSFVNPLWSGTFTGSAMDFAVAYVDVIIATKD